MAAVDERREGCEWCQRSVSLDELTTVTMTEDERIACCPRCEADARRTAKKLAAIDRQRATCDGCTDEFSRTDLESAVLPDGAVITCCPDCLAEVPGRGDRTDAERVETTELATRRNRCSQCHDRVDVELFRVTTIDGRTEEMCPDCKAVAEDDGVVSDVKMREAEAREVLDVGSDASDARIREAFLVQIKSAHPDRKTGSRSAFKLVKEAYDRLG